MFDGQVRHILLVEDEALIAMSESRTLEKSGYRVLHARTGESAVHIAKEQPEIDLVLMDIDLGPGIDGTEAARLILEDRDLPIVFLSSHTDPAVVEKTEQITSYGYIVKNSGDTVLNASIKMAFRLFESRQLSTDTFNHSINGLCVHKMLYDDAGAPYDCEYLRVNSAFVSHTGVSADNLIGKTVRDLYPGDEAREVLELYTDVMSNRQAVRKEIWFRPSEMWFELSVFPTTGDEFTVVMQNITERKRATDALAQEKERLLVTLQSVGDAVVATDAEGCVTLLNPVAEQLIGCTAATGMGRPLTEIFTILNSRTREAVEDPVSRVLAEGRVIGLSNNTLLVSAKGEEYQIADSAAPIRSRSGEIIGVVLVFRDVTQEYADAETLREERARYSTIAEMSPIGISIVDADGVITYANGAAERILGLKRDLITSRTYDAPEWEHTAPEGGPFPDERQPFSIVKRTLKPVYGIRHGITWPNGRHVELSISASPIVDEAGCFGGMIAMIEDITERKEAEDHVLALLEEKELLLQESHHRVTNNMSTIHSLLTLQSHATDSPIAKENLTDAARRLQTIARVYDTLFRDNHTGPRRIGEFLPPLINELVDVFPAVVPIQVTTEVEDFLVDSKRLTSLGIVVNELITNSVKHAFTGIDEGAISVTVGQKDGMIVFSYRDNGPGLEADLSTEETSGFGMQLIRATVESMNGRMRIHPGPGFHIELEISVPGTER